MSKRRQLLQCAAGASLLPWWAAGQAQTVGPERPRLVFVLLRGGMDGLAAVPVPGDPHFAAARGALAQTADPLLPLHGPFALHPALAQLHQMYRSGDALVLHAVGLPYQQRSHFDAQQVLESGGQQPYELDDGWLGRALATRQGSGLALSTAVPLALRGSAQIDTWAPSRLPEPEPDLLARLQALYAGDAQLGPALARAAALHADPAMGAGRRPADGAGNAELLARQAADWLSRPQGPTVAMLELGGWDTHAGQTAPAGALVRNLAQLDRLLGKLRDGLQRGGAWQRSVVLVATEFGRQVAMNGTQGTDHGSGGAAFMLGGAVAGGRVLADWPGLAPAQLSEGRDLRITTDLRALWRAVLGPHLQLSAAQLDRVVLPGSAGLPALQGLLKG